MASQSTATICKSCRKCQDIYSLLNEHIINDHGKMSGNSGTLNTILLNILSLMTSAPTSNQTTATTSNSDDRCQTIPMPVISKAIVDAEQMTTQQESFINPTTTSNPSISSFSSDFTNQATYLHPRLSLPTDLLSLFTHTNTPTKNEFQNQTLRSSIAQNKLLPTVQAIPNLLESTFMLPSGSEIQSTTNLIGSDGSLTPAGISLLLANQNKTEGSGKLDLDVADILVNKMPIPSLNKGLDSSLLQTLYLQQLAMNQQIPLGATQLAGQVASPAASITTTELATLMAANRDRSSGNSNLRSANDSGSQSESLQQVIARHKHISELIEALTNKQKRNKDDALKIGTFVVPATLTSSAMATSLSNIPETSIHGLSVLSDNNKTTSVSLLQVPPILTIDEAVESSSGKNAVSSKFLIGNDEPTTGHIKKNPHVVLENYPSQNLLNLLKSQNKVTVDDSAAQFLRQRSDIIPTTLLSKNMLRDLVIDSKIEVSSAAAASATSRTYSSVTMVPISQYNPVDSNNEQLGSVVTQQPSDSMKMLYKCDLCNVTFSVLATLHTHLKSHSMDKAEQCSYCHLTFTEQEKYFEHLASHRGEENVFRCQFCPQIFTSKGDYNKHVTKHTQKRPYLCSHCHKAFRDPGSLIKHERIHTGEQPYVCQECNRGFAEKSSLRKHIRIHSGEKPYKCDQCDKSFSISGNLQRHMFIHSGEKPFKCTECSKAFNNPSHLRRHIKNLHLKLNAATLNIVAPKLNGKADIGVLQKENDSVSI